VHVICALSIYLTYYEQAVYIVPYLTVAPLPVSPVPPIPVIPSNIVHFELIVDCNSDNSGGIPSEEASSSSLISRVSTDPKCVAASSSDENCLFNTNGDDLDSVVFVGEPTKLVDVFGSDLMLLEEDVLAA